MAEVVALGPLDGAEEFPEPIGSSESHAVIAVIIAASRIQLVIFLVSFIFPPDSLRTQYAKCVLNIVPYFLQKCKTISYIKDHRQKAGGPFFICS